MHNILITGGCGFIGSNFIKHIMDKKDFNLLINVDKLTYAGSMLNVVDLNLDTNHVFIKTDINDKAAIKYILDNYNIDYIVNFAAESHVDRSIEDSDAFMHSNILGVKNLLDCCREYGKLKLFIQISTDEVYGSAKPGQSFKEDASFNPGSPYAASKAAAEMICKAYANTYKIPITITRCSNNYGPKQYPEKLIPVVISKALNNEKIPVYGDGKNEREWIYVDDHCEAIYQIIKNNIINKIYNISSKHKMSNLSLIKIILNKLDKKTNLIEFVADRLGHDRIYSINSNKIRKELKWKPTTNFYDGLSTTIRWYRERYNA